ncbi:MAG: flavodoxin family protein, partial [Endomicrobiia bacterium]
MKLLAIYGSPRENGNSDILLNYALNGVKDSGVQYEKIFLRDINIKYCRGCRACDTIGLCIISDEMKTIYEKLETSNRIIVSSPIYFYGVSAQLKTIIDRSQCFWARKYLLKKPI